MILIALIALARKFVILDPEVDPGKIAALAGATLALGVVYWLMCESGEKNDSHNTTTTHLTGIDRSQ